MATLVIIAAIVAIIVILADRINDYWLDHWQG